MNTKRCFMFILVVFSFFTLLIYAQVADADDPGKKAFVDNKCNTCHSIATEAVEKKMAGSKAPDLSGVGAKQTADFFVKYLKKEAALNEKKHTKGWTGKEEDLQAIAKWLESLKKPAATK